MLLANTTSFQDERVHIPYLLWNILTTLNLSVALWRDNSTFSLAVTNELIFEVPVLHFDSSVNLQYLPHIVIVLAFGKPSSVNSAPTFYPVPKRKVLLLTDSFDGDTLERETWFEQLDKYKHARLIWLDLHSTNFKMFSLSHQEKERLSEIESEDAFNIFQDIKPNKIPNFQESEIIVTVTNFSIYSYISPGNDEANYTDGIQAIVFNEACRLMNLKPKYLMDKHYGSFQNGTFTEGMQKNVMEMKTDTLIGGAYCKPGAMGLIEMSEPWGFLCVRYLVPRPKQLNSIRYVMMNVFSWTTWLTTLGAILLVTGISTVIAKNSRNAAFKNYRNIISSFLMATFQLIQIRHPSRSEYVGCFFPLLLSWGCFGFFLTTAYNSELAASFTKPRFSEKIQTEAEFIQQGYTWGTQESDEWWLVFDMDNPTTNTWVNEHRQKEEPGDRERKLRQGAKYIMVGFSYGKIFYYRDNDKPSDDLTYSYEVADNCIKTMFTGIMFPPGSPYLHGLNLITSRLISAGILQKLEYDEILSRPLLKRLIPKGVFSMNRNIRVTAAYAQLALSTFYEIFYVLLLGYSIAAVVFICEMAINKNKQNRNPIRDNVELTKSELHVHKLHQQRYYVFRLTPLSR